MAWTNITNAQLAIGAPLRSIDILALRDNIIAVRDAMNRGQVFTSSGSFVVPEAVSSIKVTVVGGGGNGGSVNNFIGAIGGGGGGGGISTKYITGLTSGDSIPVTVGGAGGTSSFGAYCSATGGQNGLTDNPSIRAGGSGSGGDINQSGGESGGGEQSTAGAASGAGGAAGGGSASNSISFYNDPIRFVIGGIGGGGRFGRGANAKLNGVGQTGLNGVGFGSGGSGAVRDSSSASGGAGVQGVVIVEW